MTGEIKAMVLAALRRAIDLVESDKETELSWYRSGPEDEDNDVDDTAELAQHGAGGALEEHRRAAWGDCWHEDIEHLEWGVRVAVERVASVPCPCPWCTDPAYADEDREAHADYEFGAVGGAE